MGLSADGGETGGRAACGQILWPDGPCLCLQRLGCCRHPLSCCFGGEGPRGPACGDRVAWAVRPLAKWEDSGSVSPRMHGGLPWRSHCSPIAASEQLTRTSLPAPDLRFCAFYICGKGPRAPRAASLYFLLIGLVGLEGPQGRWDSLCRALEGRGDSGPTDLGVEKPVSASCCAVWDMPLGFSGPWGPICIIGKTLLAPF